MRSSKQGMKDGDGAFKAGDPTAHNRRSNVRPDDASTKIKGAGSVNSETTRSSTASTPSSIGGRVA